MSQNLLAPVKFPPQFPDHTQLPESDSSFVKSFQEHPQSLILTDSIGTTLERIHPDGQYVIGQDCGIYWRETEPLAIGDLILAEALQGFRQDSDYTTAKQLLISLTVFNLLNSDLAIKSADNFRALRKQGITVRKTIDVIIATFCIQENHALMFSDRDFIPFVQHLGLNAVL